MGKIELDHTGSGSGVTLSSDGTDLLLDGTPIGGGGGPATIDAKTGAYTVTTDDVGKVLLFTLTGAATCSLPAAATAGSGFFVEIINDSASVTQILTIDPDGSETINDTSTLKLTRNSGIKLYCTGTEWRTAHGLHSAVTHNFSDGNMNPTVTGDSAFAIGDTVTASGTFSFALGRSANASSSRAMAIGNSTSASGSDSLAMVQSANASGSYAVAIGKDSIASGNQSTVLGGFGNDATATYATTLGGSANLASGINSAAIGGSSNEANGSYSYATGQNAKTSVLGKWVHSSGLFASKGDAQRGWQVQRTDTSGFDIQPLTTNGSSENSSNQIKVPTDAAVAFRGMIVAKEGGTTDCAAWIVEGLAVNDGGTSTLVNFSTTVINNTPSWGLATQIDNGNDVVQFLAVGATSHNIKWVAAIDTVEVVAA